MIRAAAWKIDFCKSPRLRCFGVLVASIYPAKAPYKATALESTQKWPKYSLMRPIFLLVQGNHAFPYPPCQKFAKAGKGVERRELVHLKAGVEWITCQVVDKRDIAIWNFGDQSPKFGDRLTARIAVPRVSSQQLLCAWIFPLRINFLCVSTPSPAFAINVAVSRCSQPVMKFQWNFMKFHYLVGKLWNCLQFQCDAPWNCLPTKLIASWNCLDVGLNFVKFPEISVKFHEISEISEGGSLRWNFTSLSVLARRALIDSVLRGL